MKPNSFGETVSDEEVKTVNHMLHHSLAEEEAEKPGNRLCNPLAYTLAEMEPKKFGDSGRYGRYGLHDTTVRSAPAG